MYKLWVLDELLEQHDDAGVQRFLEEFTIEEITANKSMLDMNNLSQLAVRNNSLVLLNHLVKHQYNMNEVDDFGRTTYNYLQLYWKPETVEQFLESGIVEDQNLDEMIETLEEARKHPIKDLDKANLEAAHAYTFDNAQMLFARQSCVCIYCWERYESSEIIQISNSTLGTALCPKCGIDAIVGEISGFELSDEFIGKMYDRFFNSNEDYSHADSRLELLGEWMESKSK